MDWLFMFLIVCLGLGLLHFNMRMDKIERSYRNWAQGVVDECNASLGRYYAGYKSDVSEWLKDFIDRYMYSHDAEFSVTEVLPAEKINEENESN